MQHKAFCNCKLCAAARDKLKQLGPRRKLPPGVVQQWLDKRAKQEEEMLLKGYILFTCPSCKHTAFAKIGRQMKCECCGKVYS